MEVKYYVCNHCGNIIEMLKDQGVPVMCCGEAMHELRQRLRWIFRLADTM